MGGSAGTVGAARSAAADGRTAGDHDWDVIALVVRYTAPAIVNDRAIPRFVLAARSAASGRTGAREQACDERSDALYREYANPSGRVSFSTCSACAQSGCPRAHPFSRLKPPLTETGQDAQPARFQGRVVVLRTPARTTPFTRGFPRFARCGPARPRPHRGSVKGMVPWTA